MRQRHFIAVLLTLAAFGCAGGDGCGESVYVRSLPTVKGTAKPDWGVPPTKGSGPPQQPSEVQIHLDISAPMAGFLPLAANSSDLSALHLIAQNVSQHMARVYGGSEVTVQRYGVGHELRKLPTAPRIERALFNGRSTQLELSIKRILSDMRSGYVEAAAIVTDLMATGDVTGPLALSAQLREWLETDEARIGDFHVGLFGVKAAYWGIWDPQECPPGPRLGCWYDERVQEFRPLESVSYIPVYALVLGRGAEDVTSVMESLQRGFEETDQSTDFQWELLTRSSFDTAVSCRTGSLGDGGELKPQYALVRDDCGTYTCVRDSTVTLDCEFASGEDSFLPNHGRATLRSTSTGHAVADSRDDNDANPLPEAIIRLDGSRRIAVDLDCSVMRNHRANLRLDLDMSGTANRPEKDWSGWSTEGAALGKTLNLDDFVQELRIEPDRYRVNLPGVLKPLGG